VAALRERVAREIGPIAKPRHVIAVPDLPRTRSGKIMRRLLAQLVHAERERRRGVTPEPLGDVTSLQNPEAVGTVAAVLAALPADDPAVGPLPPRPDPSPPPPPRLPDPTPPPPPGFPPPGPMPRPASGLPRRQRPRPAPAPPGPPRGTRARPAARPAITHRSRRPPGGCMSLTVPASTFETPLKFAYWVPNVSGGLVVSTIEQRTDWQLPYNSRLAQIAEASGFD